MKVPRQWKPPLLVLFAVTPLMACAGDGAMVLVPAGTHRPLFRSDTEPAEVPVSAFQLETRPVTNGEFLEFVRDNPRWQRSQVKRLFADASYLSHWAGDLDLGPDRERIAAQPVTFVSWFAAKSYVAWKGARLPTTFEWEYAAGAGFTVRDGSKDPEFTAAISRWYATPAPSVLPAAGAGPTNVFGVHNMHGLIWEWTSDFNSALVTGDARGDTGLERQLFCAGGSLDAKDRANYPAFMRYGFRSSLKAGYAIGTLGFRCAKDFEP